MTAHSVRLRTLLEEALQWLMKAAEPHDVEDSQQVGLRHHVATLPKHALTRFAHHQVNTLARTRLMSEWPGSDARLMFGWSGCHTCTASTASSAMMEPACGERADGELFIRELVGW